MTKLDSHFSDVEWLEKVHDLLIEVARAALADLPRLPEKVRVEALPLAQNAEIIQQNANKFSRYFNWPEQEEWLEEVRKLLVELSRLSLSERPRLPENMAQRVLILAETAQDLKENLPDIGDEEWDLDRDPSDSELHSFDESSLSSLQLLQHLHSRLQAEQASSSNPQLPQWQQVLILLDVVSELYGQIHRSS
ncbi:MAG: hypothetical protein SWJ54_05805 [Cyanobacteriota bacterium]|nr:hypothetical protein [Cyanobacteriota bacterium]